MKLNDNSTGVYISEGLKLDVFHKGLEYEFLDFWNPELDKDLDWSELNPFIHFRVRNLLFNKYGRISFYLEVKVEGQIYAENIRDIGYDEVDEGKWCRLPKGPKDTYSFKVLDGNIIVFSKSQYDFKTISSEPGKKLQYPQDSSDIGLEWSMIEVTGLMWVLSVGIDNLVYVSEPFDPKLFLTVYNLSLKP